MLTKPEVSRSAHLRVRHKRTGGHVAMRLFIGKEQDQTHACIGTLCVANDEWPFMRSLLHSRQVEFVDETELER